MDWKVYTEAIENLVKFTKLKKNVKELSEKLQKVITNAVKRHASRRKLGKGKISCVKFPAVCDAIKERDILRK